MFCNLFRSVAIVALATAVASRAFAGVGDPPAEGDCDENPERCTSCAGLLESRTSELASCNTELQECEAAFCSRFPATGQTRAIVSGEDGNPAYGAALSYTDTGLTVIDNNTGLEWEKKNGTQGSLNSYFLNFAWSGVCSVTTTVECGVDGDCPVAEACVTVGQFAPSETIFEWLAQLNAANFAGHSDWRIPNVKELQSILNYGVIDGNLPHIDPIFGPTTPGVGWWSSTVHTINSTISLSAWKVAAAGSIFPADKAGTVIGLPSGGVRAVRGGTLTQPPSP